MVDHPRVRVLAAAAAMALLPAGCFEDSDCGICDENSLELQILSGTNYTGELVHIVSPKCEGARCPAPFTEARRFVETLGLCEDSDAAQLSPQGPNEFCRIAPIVAASGLQFVFNNLLEPSSIELVRKRPDVPQLFETYDWKTQIVSLQGPVSRYSGDWRTSAADGTSEITRFVNLSCVDNLRAAMIPFTAESYADPANNPCNALSDGPDPLPWKLQADKALTATRGKWDDRAIGEAAAYDCETPVDGVDTCCSQCDFSLTVNVSKYGAGERIECDPQGDRLIDCAGFVVAERRDDEPGGFVPAEDLLRGVHPALRTDERATIACDSDDDCRDPAGPGLPGAECVGVDDQDRSCSPGAGDPTCTQGRCRAPWFGACKADPDTTGDVAYCVDARYDEAAAAGCHVRASDGTRLSECDANADGKLTASECCPEGTSCDPVYDLGYDPVARYERKSSLPGFVRDLGCDGGCGDDCGVCDDDGGCSANGRECTDQEITDCAEQYYVSQTCSGAEDEHDHAINLVTKLGGVIYDGALKGVEWRPADRGGQPRAVIEACAESRGLIAPRSVADGWRAHDGDGYAVELDADWDLSMCSGQTYQVVFTPSDGGEHVVDKKGNTLDGKRTYTFETPQFRAVPSSGFPGDNLRIGACDTFSLSFSNKFDLSPENLRKVEIHDLSLPEGQRTVAGGPGCAETRDEQEASAVPPCLDVDVSEQAAGEIHVRLDTVQFDPVLREGQTYGFYVPGILDPQAGNLDVIEPADYAEAVALSNFDAETYAQAFWDACGMPLFQSTEVKYVPDPTDPDKTVVEKNPDGSNRLYYVYDYTFTVDPARCEEDGDSDGVQLSCDNAPDVYNPLQADADRDGVGDPLDLCPASPEVTRDTSDSDRDGVGNGCDNCPKSVSRYNDLAANNALPSYLWVRNAGEQGDADEDGIGDVCDNCPTVANCESYDVDRPWRLGDVMDADAPTCQRDADLDMIGDACVGMQSDVAAGPVGFGDDDDFDQDGLANLDDGCPRQPELDLVPCADDTACGAGRRCVGATGDAMGLCDHADADRDGVGDLCDTCAHVANAAQVLDGGAQDDDDDGDFIGLDCELGDGCGERGAPRALAFFPVSVGGQCCTTLLVDDGQGLAERFGDGRRIVDPAGRPVQVACAGSSCVQLPVTLAATPGVLMLPTGCDEALAAAGLTLEDHAPVSLEDVQSDLDALWNLQCRLPPPDQDYDGFADACDLCPFDYDPANETYTDEEGRNWPNDGAVCNGDNSLAVRCDEGMVDDGTSGDGGGTGDGTGG